MATAVVLVPIFLLSLLLLGVWIAWGRGTRRLRIKLAVAYVILFAFPWALVTVFQLTPSRDVTVAGQAFGVWLGWGTIFLLFIGFILPIAHSVIVRLRNRS